MRKLMLAALALPVLALPVFGTPASAADTVKIGYIDPLSGGGASVGEGGLKTFQYLADQINAEGGILGQKVEIVPLDNKTNPQESLIQAQKAVDAGICQAWYLEKVENGGRGDYVTVRVYNSLDKMANPWPGSVTNNLFNAEEGGCE